MLLLWLVKSPPWQHEVGDDAVEGGALNPKPFSPVQSARKFSEVWLIGGRTFQTGREVGGGSCFGFVGRFGGGSVVQRGGV